MGTPPFKNMSTAAEKAKAIIAAIDLDGDKDLTQQELVSFFDNLTKALGGDAPTRPSEEEAAELIASMGVDGHLKADAFETFLVGFCESDPEKAELILKGMSAILFEMTMDREFDGVSAPKWLWENKNVVPFVKCDKGLMDEVDGVQLMKPNPGLDDLMKRAYSLGVFGTKMRSNINSANADGIKAIVAQQFEVAKQIIGHGLCPIIEPEVNINSETKSEAEEMLK